MKAPSPWIALHPADNILVCARAVVGGEKYTISGEVIIVREDIAIGHKMARANISKGEKIMKYGAPIGSATCDIQAGEHVHLHNMTSDYIPTMIRGSANECGQTE